MMRSKTEVEKWRQIWEPLGLNIETVQPDGKLLYPDIPWKEGFRLGSNICANHNPTSDGKNVRDISADIDTRKIGSKMKRILDQTTSWYSPSGFGALFRGPVAPQWMEPLRQVRLNRIVRDKIGWTWDRVDQSALERGIEIETNLQSLGLSDPFAIHGLFPDLDGWSFILLVPSRTCRAQKNIVRLHSSGLSYCNRSRDHRHHFFTRKFFNYTTDLLSADAFFEEVMN
jgi:hypothetical protein